METVSYFKSMGGGQFFKREGAKVKIVCTYDFNPSIERTTYDDKLITALQCSPCTKEEFDAQALVVLKILFPNDCVIKLDVSYRKGNEVHR